MKITPIKTRIVVPGEIDLLALFDESIQKIADGSIVAITSKVVSLCEGRVVSKDSASKDELVERESNLYLPSSYNKYGFAFSVTKDTLIPMAGIDESNGDGGYILWPEDPQGTANKVRLYLKERFRVKNTGVIITDSTCSPLRLGTMGIAICHSGFSAINDYVGKPDLFGRPFHVSRSNVAGGLAAAAVVAMGEGAEQTPICVIEDVSFVSFQDHNPTEEEMSGLRVPLEDDLFAPFLKNADWQKGEGGK